MDLISKAEAISAIDNMRAQPDEDGYLLIYKMDAVDNIRCLPVQEPKRGYWIVDKDNIGCSECNTWYISKYMTHRSFCPNCGVLMEEE